MPSMRAAEVERPDGKLLVYYALASLVLGPLFFILLIPLYFRFRTLRYEFGDDGISMRWGVLFRREIHLTYARIQDIHLRSNLVERWLGLGRLQIQTASGSSKAEMTLEGILEFEALRDFIYERMRGVSAHDAVGNRGGAGQGVPNRAGESDDLNAVLGQVAIELRAIRELLAEHRRADR